MPKINKFFPKVFFCFLPTIGTLTSVFKGNKLRNHKNVEISVFLNFFIVDGMIRIRTKNYKSGCLAQKPLTDSTDPDREHCKLDNKISNLCETILFVILLWKMSPFLMILVCVHSSFLLWQGRIVLHPLFPLPHKRRLLTQN
jgi:hypothetical protein